MPLNRDDILNAVTVLAEEKKLQATFVESAKGACTIGISALAGGLLGGPVGLGIGGTLGSIYAAITGYGKYKSVVEVIMNDMTPKQRNELAINVENVIKGLDATDLIMLSSLLMSNTSLQQLVIAEITNYFKSEMHMALY